MTPEPDILRAMTRRHFFKECGTGLGTMALASLMNESLFATAGEPTPSPLSPKPPHFAPKVKNIIYLFMAGAPSQLDLFDHKPQLQRYHGQAIPEEIIKGERFAFIKDTPKLLGSPYRFGRHGTAGTEVSELLPHIAGVVDEIAVVRAALR
jgi:hypothetical protein